MNQKDNGNEPLRYFVPGELIVTVEHSKKFSREEFVNNPVFFLKNKDDAVDELLRTLEKELNITEDDRAIVEKARSDVATKLGEPDWVDNALGESAPFVGGTGTSSFVRLKVKGINNEAFNNEALIYLANELEIRIERKLIRQKGEQKVVGVSLNWLWSSAPDNTTTGGPGSLPISPKLPLLDEEDEGEFGVWEPGVKPDILKDPQSEEAQNARDNLKKRLNNRFSNQEKTSNQENNGPSSQETGCTIEIVILDTIPLPKTLNKWEEGPNKYLKRLIQHLRSGPGNLHYYKDPLKSADVVFNFVDPKRPYDIKDYPYTMPDHGLFIAGIIHKIAPNARIRMIEVLNEFGVGSSPALIWGLQQIIECCKQNGQDTRHIINSSLTIGFSCDAANIIAKKEERSLTAVEKFLCLLEALSRTSDFSFLSSIKKKYDEVADRVPNIISVAAAGNDNPAETDGQSAYSSSPRARFPAAFGSVIGVGALTRKGKLARYTNKPDEPEPEGFYIFGGDVDGKQDVKKGRKKKGRKWKASKTDGILGVYTYDTYPDGTKNTSGWARWAGTSFASAMATGMLARIDECEDGAIRLTDYKAVVEFLQTVAEEKENGGHVLPVGQGKRGLNP